MRWLLVLSLTILLPACKPMWLQTKQYSGDGVIHVCSNLLSGGYAIKFVEFDSTHSYSASFRLSNVPQVSGFVERDPLLYLRFQWNGPFYQWAGIQKRLTGKIGLILRDSQERVVNSTELFLSDATFTGAAARYGAYDSVKTRLHFAPNGKYVLQVTYIPGEVVIPAARLYFEIGNCAYY